MGGFVRLENGHFASVYYLCRLSSLLNYNTLNVAYGTHIVDNRNLHFLQYIHIYAIAGQYFSGGSSFLQFGQVISKL